MVLRGALAYPPAESTPMSRVALFEERRTWYSGPLQEAYELSPHLFGISNSVRKRSPGR
jgi:hypothetical protein